MALRVAVVVSSCFFVRTLALRLLLRVIVVNRVCCCCLVLQGMGIDFTIEEKAGPKIPPMRTWESVGVAHACLAPLTRRLTSRYLKSMFHGKSACPWYVHGH